MEQFGRPQKRKFIPTFDSVFGTGRYRKPQQAPNTMLSSFFTAPSSLGVYPDESLPDSSKNRDQLINFMTYSHQSHPPPHPFQSPIQQAPLNSAQLNLQRQKQQPNIFQVNSSLGQTQNRHRFKARPVPRSHYNNPKIPIQFNTQKQNTQFRPSNTFGNQKRNSFERRPQQDLSYNLLENSEDKMMLDQVPNLNQSMIGIQEINFTEQNSFIGNFQLNQSFSGKIRSNQQISSNLNKSFSARIMPNFEQPFKPLPSDKPLTVPKNYFLHTEKRTENRSFFQQQLREKERLDQFQRRAQEIQNARREQEAVRKIRKQMEFKARPMQHGQPFSVQYQQRRITIPQRPFLQTAQRAESKDFDKYLNTSFSDRSTNMTFY